MKNKESFYVIKTRFFQLVGIFVLGALLIQAAGSKRTNYTISENALEETKKVHSACQDETYFVTCYEKEFARIVQKQGFVFAKDVLVGLWNLDERVRACHALAHRIALAQVEKDPSSWNTVLLSIDPQLCSGGFFHGILEGHSRFDPSFELTKKQIEKICSNRNNTYDEGSCLHIVGHLLLVEFEGDMKKAIAICDELSLTSTNQCYSGVFMENMTKENLKEHGLAQQVNWTTETINDTESLCRSYNGKAANGCWGEIGYMYAAVYSDDAEKVFTLCKQATDEEFIRNCYEHGFAKIAVTADTQSKVNILCDFYKEDINPYNSCVKKVVNAMLITSIKFFDRAVAFCVQSSESVQYSCFEGIADNLTKLEPKEEKNFCGQFPEKFRNVCG